MFDTRMVYLCTYSTPDISISSIFVIYLETRQFAQHQLRNLALHLHLPLPGPGVDANHGPRSMSRAELPSHFGRAR